MSEEPVTREEAIEMIAEGHNVYAQAGADQVCDALGVPRLKGRPMYSDPAGTVKGLTMDVEGAVCVSALDLGSHACQHFGLEARECFGRGSQGRAYANALREHFGMERRD